MTTSASHRRYHGEFDLPSAMVSGHVHENRDGTVFLYFENEHGEYGVALDVKDAAVLVAYLQAGFKSAERSQRAS